MTGSYETFKKYTAAIDQVGPDETHLRDLLDFNYPETGVPLDEVESVESIVKRFKTAAMSYGALSEEAHECMAIAMNRLGGKEQHRRRRRGRRPLRDRAQFGHQAGGFGPVRRDQPVSGLRQRDPDQDGPGCQARRGRAAARRQGLPLGGQDPPLHHRRGADLSPRPTTTSTPSRIWPS